MTTTPVASSARPKVALWALITTVLVVAQVVLAIIMLSGSWGLTEAHGGLGYLAILTSAVAAFFAWKVGRAENNKGIFFHAVSMPVLMLVQVGLAHMNGLRTVHMTVGVAILVGLVGLWMMARKKA